jgi:hypothetical protein
MSDLPTPGGPQIKTGRFLAKARFKWLFALLSFTFRIFSVDINPPTDLFN